MALLWADGFDHWGSGAEAIVGGYQEFSIGLSTVAGIPRTGAYGIRRPDAGNVGFVRRALDAPLTKGGIGLAYKWTVAPGGSGDGLMFFQTAATGVAFDNNNAIGIWANSDLSISIMRGTTFIGKSAANTFVLGSYDQYEIKVDASGAAGTHTVAVRKNGIDIVSATGLTIPTMNFACIMGGDWAGGPCRYMDDFYLWDASGGINNDWLGDRKCLTLLPNADGALQDWVPNTGSAFDAINDVPAGANYITSTTAGEVSEFSKPNIPIATTSIAGIVLFAQAAKADAGAASFRVGMNKAGIVQNSPPINPGTVYSYGKYIMQTDPDGLAWTKATLDAATMRVTREA